MATHIELNRTGDKMPIVGFGCWKVEKDCADTIYNAIKAGYRLIDGAAAYENEVEVGQGIARAIQEGIVKREDLFVVSKLWNTDHHKDHVRPAFDRTLKDMGLDYIDLYLVHFPIPVKHVDPKVQYPGGWENPETKKMEYQRSPLHLCWAEMEKLVDAGLVRNIGISNTNVMMLLDMFSYCRYKPATLQVELHPYLQQNNLVRWVQSQDVAITAYSSFGPASYVQLNEAGKTAKPLLTHETIEQVAKKYSKSPAQVLLRWSVQRNVAVIPKSMNVDRMKANLDLFDWTLEDEDIKTINSLEMGARFNDTLEYGIDLPLFD
ncbi:4-dihydromethyltrisporate dehydrogenase [Hesseltinella vesiculosa]|uniref:4-dihydromethyltrisporate dehydrogenase n=1 Tax=Hesseltinella vesiculosa TaxID=101127 RepID=A0A1X2GQM4_9FUNG|nr:4-dihydromethyltrisporate dehydrogenase [Hesseltinella vesiculosa]